jgi:hypothetical protein
MFSSEPIFIIANPRSGSTLLRLMLTSHPNICVPPECGWIVGKYDKYGSCNGDIDYGSFVEDFFHTSTKKVETWDILPKELMGALMEKSPNTYQELVNTVYQLYIDKHQPGKKVWGDKNNFYVHHIDELLEMFPKAKYIFLSRDGRDVAVSYMDMSQYTQKYAPRVTSDPVVAFGEWANVQSTIDRKLQGKDFVSVKYEELVQDPETVLAALCRSIGQVYSSDMLLYHKNNYEPVATLAWKQKTKEPPMTSQVGRWKNSLTPTQLESIEGILRSQPNLHRFMYNKE